MQHVVDAVSAPTAHSATLHQHPTAMTTDNASQSSASSPKSQKTLLDHNASQVSESTLPSLTTHELTPPSSIASSHEHDVDQQRATGIPMEGASAVPAATGRKRTANGQVKVVAKVEGTSVASVQPSHVQSGGTLSVGATTGVGELSQQLRTKLTYAMLKVQNGWQKHSLDEIESIASQSPRSVIAGFPPKEYQPLVSPRTVLAAGMRQNSDTSSSSDQSLRQQPRLAAMTAPDTGSSYPRKALAPPAPIMSGNRRRPTPNMHLHINNSLKPAVKPSRPAATQRTPSQNAAMEADAVETLLFMSASPNNSGHFPSHLSTYSPTSQAFSTQNTPLKSHFSPYDRELPRSAVAYSPPRSYRRARYEHKAELIDRLLHDLDDDESEELDRALKIVEQHQAAKLSA